MSLQVHTNAAPVKALNHAARGSNLLKMAIHGLSGGVRSGAPRDEAGAFGAGDSFVQKAQGEIKKPILRDDPMVIDASDRFLASVSGLARMGGFLQSPTSPATDPENARDSAVNAQRGIAANPILALDAQANQTPGAVMKLLE